MSKSLVLDFENKIIDSRYSISDLLRHCLIIAKKLKQEDCVEWINKELNGYGKDDNIPEYRLIPMTIKFYNEIYGWCPVVTLNKEVLDALKRISVREKISEIECLAKTQNHILFSAPYEIKKNLLQEISFDSDIAYEASVVSILGIIDSVKNRLLEWILLLEENQIIDVENIFSSEQIEKADKLSLQVTNIFNGNNNKINIEQVIDKSSEK